MMLQPTELHQPVHEWPFMQYKMPWGGGGQGVGRKLKRTKNWIKTVFDIHNIQWTSLRSILPRNNWRGISWARICCCGCFTNRVQSKPFSLLQQAIPQCTLKGRGWGVMSLWKLGSCHASTPLTIALVQGKWKKKKKRAQSVAQSYFTVPKNILLLKVKPGSHAHQVSGWCGVITKGLYNLLTIIWTHRVEHEPIM